METIEKTLKYTKLQDNIKMLKDYISGYIIVFLLKKIKMKIVSQH